MGWSLKNEEFKDSPFSRNIEFYVLASVELHALVVTTICELNVFNFLQIFKHDNDDNQLSE